VAGFYEAVYRNGVFSRRRNLLTLADARTALHHPTAAVPAYVVEDIAEQVKLAEQPFAPFRQLPDGQRVCGPVFAGSGDLGGADADFVVGALLIDCKVTTRPHTIHRSAAQQLSGYLLLDYDDTYGIDRVGLYLSRQGALIAWHVPPSSWPLSARVFRCSGCAPCCVITCVRPSDRCRRRRGDWEASACSSMSGGAGPSCT
jgi:hypothetical protein